MHIGYRNLQAYYFLQGNAFARTTSEKDFRTVITDDFKFSKQLKKVQ